MLKHKRYLLIPALLLAGALVSAQTATVTDRETRGHQLMRGTYNVGTPQATEAECRAGIAPDVLARSATSLYKCRTENVYLGTYSAAAPVVCPAAPAASTSSTSQACPAGTTGGPIVTTVTDTYTMGPPDACLVTSVRTSTTEGVCAPVVVTGSAVYISPAGNDSATGTQAAPKLNLTAAMIASASPGTAFLMQCNASHTMAGKVVLRNLSARDANRITIGTYGDCVSGPPVLNYPANTVSAFEFGQNFGDGTPHEGYTIQGLRLVRAPSTNEGWGIYFKNDISKVTLQGMSFAGWTTNINAQGGHRTREILVQSNDLRGFAGGHGVLGRFTDSEFLDNISEPGATGFTHAFYLSEGSGNVLRRNRIIKTGVCTGGGITMHSGYTTGQGESSPKPIAGVTVEGNTFEYSEPPAASCYAVSLSPYESAPAPGGFSEVIVRNNKIINASTPINVVAAPGALIDGNVVINTTDFGQTAVSYRNYAEDPADLSGPGTVSNNTVCRPSGSSGITAPAGSTVSNNVVVTGTAATQGVCAIAI